MVAHPPDPELMMSQIRGLSSLLRVTQSRLQRAEGVISVQDDLITSYREQNDLLKLQVKLLEEAS